MDQFAPLENNNVRMYTCGPTVYDYPHIGNYRTFLFEDILRRYLKFKGYVVTQVMNLTDVDDKTIRGARKEGIQLRKYTEGYVKAFFEDLDTLRIERAEFYPRATEFIDVMVNMTKKLKEKGYAYESEGSVYFDITKFISYGKLSGLVIEELKTGARIKSDEYGKEEARDFALWKGWDADDGDVFWETEVGKGRPGWHIECSAMSMKLLGESFDIHAGGVDLIFPHHENEIAQSEAATGKRFARYWLHSEHLMVEGQRMAKSLGNFYTLRELIEKGHDPIAIRYLLISSHYRAQQNFTFESLKQAGASVARLQSFLERVSHATIGAHSQELEELTGELLRDFEDAMDSDLNTPIALAALFEYLRRANSILDDGTISENNKRQMLSIMQRIDSVLAVIVPPVRSEPDAEIERLIKERNEARARKDWTRADRIREEIRRRGYELEDLPIGTRFKKVRQVN